MKWLALLSVCLMTTLIVFLLASGEENGTTSIDKEYRSDVSSDNKSENMESANSRSKRVVATERKSQQQVISDFDNKIPTTREEFTDTYVLANPKSHNQIYDESDPDWKKKRLEKTREHFMNLERMFELEPEDPAWERKFKNAFYKEFNASPVTDLVDIEFVACRTTRCTVDLKYRDTDELDENIREVVNWMSDKQPCEFHVPGHVLLDRNSTGKTLQRIYIICKR